MDVRFAVSQLAFGWRNRHEVTLLVGAQAITFVPDQTGLEILLPEECDLSSFDHLRDTWDEDGVRIGTQDREQICPGSLVVNAAFRIGDGELTAGWLTIDSNSIIGVYVNVGTRTGTLA